MFGNGGGLYSEGNVICLRSGLFSHRDRPYLHVYKHSNEIEEVTVIGLDGVNVESNPEMESLLGVGTAYPFAYLILTYPKRDRSHSHSLLPRTHTHLRRLISGSCGHGQPNWIPHVYLVNRNVFVADQFLDAVSRTYIISPRNSIIPYFVLSLIYSLETMYAAPYPNHDNYDVYDFYLLWHPILPCLGNRTGG